MNQKKKMIKTLELITNSINLEDFNLNSYYEVMEYYLQKYNDWTFKIVIKHVRYPLSTIATLDELLKSLHITNDVYEIARKIYGDA